MTSENSAIHMRTDANNLVTTAQTTKVPEQKDTIHLVNQLRHEACSGNIQDLAHVATHDMLADCLTKGSVKPDYLIMATRTGILPNLDKHPLFRDLIKSHHKAYLTHFHTHFTDWVHTNLPISQTQQCRGQALFFLGFPLTSSD